MPKLSKKIIVILVVSGASLGFAAIRFWQHQQQTVITTNRSSIVTATRDLIKPDMYSVAEAHAKTFPLGSNATIVDFNHPAFCGSLGCTYAVVERGKTVYSFVLPPDITFKLSSNLCYEINPTKYKLCSQDKWRIERIN
jgi:hypothetical protein